MTVEIHAEMRLKASDGEPTPPVRVKVKRTGQAGRRRTSGE